MKVSESDVPDKAFVSTDCHVPLTLWYKVMFAKFISSVAEQLKTMPDEVFTLLFDGLTRVTDGGLSGL